MHKSEDLEILALTEAAAPSVILIRKERQRAAAVFDLLQQLFDEHGENLRNGCILSVGRLGTRIRVLPMK
jgi:hypothetical protein